MSTIAENIRTIRETMAEAARQAGRDPSEIRLCAATKMNDAAACREAIAAGIDALGENRVQEMTAHLAAGAYEGAHLHFIGHLQTNKVRQVVGRVELIESVGSEHLLEAIEAQAAKLELVQDILLEVNVAAEESKSGFTPEEAPEIAARMGEFSHCRLLGLMAIPPISENSGDNCRYFEKIHTIAVDITAKKYDNVRMDCLSMGMSEDYADAIACGSTMIRVGTAIFGARNYNK